MFTLDPMADLRVLVSSFLSLLMMLATQSSNSMATIGRVDHLKSVRIDSLVPDLGSEAVEVSVDVEALVEASEPEVALEDEGALEVALVEPVVDSAAVMEDPQAALMLALEQ